MWKFVLSLWKKVEGSALWDGAKWLWALGGASVTAMWNAIHQFLQGHRDLISLVIAVSPVIVFALVAVAVTKTRHAATSSPAGPSMPPELVPNNSADVEKVIARILNQGDKLRKEVPKVGSYPGADALWKNAVADWYGEGTQFISNHRPLSDLARFKAYVDPSQLAMDRLVYDRLISDHADFVMRLELLTEMLAPEQRIASLKQKLEIAKSKIKHLTDGVEVIERRKLTHSLLRMFINIVNKLQSISNAYLFDGAMMKPFSGVSLPSTEDGGKWEPRDFALLDFQIRYVEYHSVVRNCGFFIPHCQQPNQNSEPPVFGSEISYPEAVEQLKLHSMALQSYAARLDVDVVSLINSSMDHT